MSKAHKSVRGAMIVAACLAVWAGCSQGNSESGKSTEPNAPVPQPGVNHQQSTAPTATRVVSGPKVPHAVETEKVLVQEHQGLVVKSERDSTGSVTSTVYNADQTTLLFEQKIFAGEHRAHIRHIALDVEMDVEPDIDANAMSLAETNLAALRAYGVMPRDRNVSQYDGAGCDFLSDFLTCGRSGGCCDTHDYCYWKNGCTQGSWTGGEGPECSACNAGVVLCILGPATGPSSCCALGSCKTERPPCCDTRKDGTCDCSTCDPETAASPVCRSSPQSDPEPPPEAPPCVVCVLPPGILGPSRSGGVPRPLDPNDKVGPATELVSRAELWPYQINFENMEGATAAAQEVVVVDYLDPSLDWSTVQFGEIYYGGRSISIPPGAMDFTVLDTPAVDGCVLFGDGNLGVRVTLSMDMQTGRFEARLKVIDPATNDWPDDPYAGILPPGLDSCSQGHVTFTAQARTDAPTGTLIKNKADIVFDNNAPITTNEVSNTLVD